MSDLRAMLTHHTGVIVFEGRVYCHPCGELLYDPLEGFFGGPLIQRGGETIGEAAHASHLNVLLSGLLAQAWDEGLRAEQRRQEPCLLHDTAGEDVPGWEMAECTCEDLTNPLNPACPHCHTIHPADAVRAIDRFDRRRRTTYAAAYTGAPTRATREQAEADYCQWRRSHGHQTGARP